MVSLGPPELCPAQRSRSGRGSPPRSSLADTLDRQAPATSRSWGCIRLQQPVAARRRFHARGAFPRSPGHRLVIWSCVACLRPVLALGWLSRLAPSGLCSACFWSWPEHDSRDGRDGIRNVTALVPCRRQADLSRLARPAVAPLRPRNGHPQRAVMRRMPAGSGAVQGRGTQIGPQERANVTCRQPARYFRAATCQLTGKRQTRPERAATPQYWMRSPGELVADRSSESGRSGGVQSVAMPARAITSRSWLRLATPSLG